MPSCSETLTREVLSSVQHRFTLWIPNIAEIHKGFSSYILESKLDGTYIPISYVLNSLANSSFVSLSFELYADHK